MKQSGAERIKKVPQDSEGHSTVSNNEVVPLAISSLTPADITKEQSRYDRSRPLWVRPPLGKISLIQESFNQSSS
jgi:hypothetical protein